MAALVVDTFTTTLSSLYSSNSNNPVTMPPSAATTFLNDSWLQIEKTASALIASSITAEHWNDTWLDSSTTSRTGSSSNGNYSSAIINSNPSLGMLATPATSNFSSSNDDSGVSNGNIPAVVASIFENIINTTTMAIANATSLDADVATATETPYVPYVMRPETYIVPVLFAFIFIVGVLGNGTLIIVFLTVRQMRNVPNT